MERSDRISALERLKNRTLSTGAVDWTDVSRNIKAGTLLPVIGNALRNDGIFEWYFKREETPEGNLALKTVDDYLSLRWADFLEYPLLDTTNLARVAIYNRVLARSDVEARENYLLFLKGILLEAAGSDPQVQDQVQRLEGQIEQVSFSDLVVELDYPQLAPGKEDPLRCLARMHLPLYITTSYYDFLERALEAQGYPPRTQVCFWSGEPASVEAGHHTQHALELSRDNPVVFHLYGLERYPSTMVVSEGDYMDYLMRLMRDTNTQESHPPPLPDRRPGLSQADLDGLPLAGLGLSRALPPDRREQAQAEQLAGAGGSETAGPRHPEERRGAQVSGEIFPGQVFYCALGRPRRVCLPAVCGV